MNLTVITEDNGQRPSASPETADSENSKPSPAAADHATNVNDHRLPLPGLPPSFPLFPPMGMSMPVGLPLWPFSPFGLLYPPYPSLLNLNGPPMPMFRPPIFPMRPQELPTPATHTRPASSTGSEERTAGSPESTSASVSSKTSPSSNAIETLRPGSGGLLGSVSVS